MGQRLVVEAEEVARAVAWKSLMWTGVAGDAPADLVGFAMDVPAADAAASHPEREGVRMMVAPGDGGHADAVVAERRAAKLGSPDDER